jgi:hypothetical protein
LPVLLLLLALSVCRFVVFQHYSNVVSVLLINTILLTIVFSAVFLVARIRKRKMKQVIGGGDIIFLFVAALNFAPVWFNIYLFCSALVAIVYLLIRFPFNKSEKRIPYAGIMALLMISFLIADTFSAFSSYNDNLILSLLVR